MASIKKFIDEIVIYREDNRWVAHSLNTDQIGVDEDLIIAIADLIKGTKALLELASKDKTIAYERKAPIEIIKKSKKAMPLPDEVYKLACDIADETWPNKDLSVAITPTNTKKIFSFTTASAHC